MKYKDAKIVREIMKWWRLFMNEILKNIESRKSVRKFTNTQVDKDIVHLILKAGFEAPSGHNSQPVHLTVVRDSNVIEQMNQSTKAIMALSDVEWIHKFGTHPKYHVLHEAPTVIIVSSKDQCYSPIEDSSAAIQNMLLAATSLGVGSVWIGLIGVYLKTEEAKSLLSIPEGYTARYAVCLGYEDPEKVSTKPGRKSETVSWIEA